MKNIKVEQVVYDNFMDYCQVAHCDENTALYTLILISHAALEDDLTFYRVKKFLAKKFNVTMEKLHKNNSKKAGPGQKLNIRPKSNMPNVF